MTIEINMKCDGLGCFNERELFETTEMAIQRAGCYSTTKMMLIIAQNAGLKLKSKKNKGNVPPPDGPITTGTSD